MTREKAWEVMLQCEQFGGMGEGRGPCWSLKRRRVGGGGVISRLEASVYF